MPEAMLADTSIGANGSPYNRWLTCPLDTAKACVLDPYFDEINGQKVLMTSIALPLLEGGKVVGVIGLDIGLATCSNWPWPGARNCSTARAR
jgi:methyl-accepting chemotaxis protein